MTDRPQPQDEDLDLATAHAPTKVARAGLVSFAGSVAGAALGFALTFILARGFGSAGAGIVLQAIAVFTIGLSVGRGGLDTGAIWMVPRLRMSSRDELGGVIRHLLVTSLLGGVVAGLLTLLVVRLFLDHSVFEAVAASAWAMPLASVTLVGTAALRGLSGVRSYIVIVQMVIPALRIVLIVCVAALGFGAAAAGFGWALAYVVGAALTVVLLIRTLARVGSAGLGGSSRRETRQQLHAYSVGRLAGSILEQGLLWLDVLLVGMIVGTAAAGVYGTAARFVAAVLVVDSAMRFVTAPIFSGLIFSGNRTEAQQLYSRSTVWLVLLGVPICLGLAVYSPLVLSWLGPDFVSGQRAMQILCIGTGLTLAAGNIQTMLLMAGRSGQAALNKFLVLATNVGLNLWLVPIWGIEAAAAAWVVSMVLDAGLATWQVHRSVGVRPAPVVVAYALVVTMLTVGVPALLCRLWLGATPASMALAAFAGAILLAAWVYLDRARLHMAELLDPLRARLAR